MALNQPDQNASGLTGRAIAWLKQTFAFKNHFHLLSHIKDYVPGSEGMVQHSNEWHTPDMALGTDLTAHTGDTANPHNTSDANLVLTDVTTNNASTSKHGFCPKFSGVSTQFLNGVGNYTAPAGGSSLIAPNYEPPLIKYKDADEVTLRKGRYHVMGYRHRGQYQEPSSTYWDLAAAVDVDVDATYSAGATSGMIGGAKVNSSFYSLFLMGNTGIVLVLPVVRIKAISYSAPSTVINPGDHASGASNENGFIAANDAWNNYRLVKWSYDAYDGNVYTIADTVDGTPDQILITGDKTGELAAGEWLQLVPPSGTSSVYLGYIQIHSDGTLYKFTKKPGWLTYIRPRIRLNGNNDTAAGNTELGSALPPMAERLQAGIYVSANGTACTAVRNDVFWDTSGSDLQIVPFHAGASFDQLRFEQYPWMCLTSVSSLRNAAQMYNGSAWVAAALSYIDVVGIGE